MAGLGVDVVPPSAGFDVLIIWTAVKHDVALRRRIPALGVVADLVGIENISFVVDFGVATQLEYRTHLFLLSRADGYFFFRRGGRRRRCHSRRSGCPASAWVSPQKS